MIQVTITNRGNEQLYQCYFASMIDAKRWSDGVLVFDSRAENVYTNILEGCAA